VSDPYLWNDGADQVRDLIAILTCALCDDADAVLTIFESLDRQQLVTLCWEIACWHADAVRDLPLGQDFAIADLRRLATIVATSETGGNNNE
jgi:hypothetical protein